MKYLYKIFYSFILFIWITGCDSTGPGLGYNPDLVTINENIAGFSFEYGRAISLPNSENIIPDIIILAHINDQGDLLGVFFAADSLRPSFNLVNYFSDSDSAKEYFYSLPEAPDSGYQDLALPLKANQVWTIRTHDNKYGKILIVNTYAAQDTITPNYHIEATFRWRYQPDGSIFFKLQNYQ